MEQVHFSCLNYKNDERKMEMQRRFNIAEIECVFYNGIDFNDDRIARYSDLIDNATKRVWSCMYGHLDMISDFYYKTNKEFGIFCEDDIYIHKNLNKYLPRICMDFKCLNLDVLLLGYLLQDKAYENNDCSLKTLPVSCSPFSYYSFPDYVWGTQMYMLSRKHCKYLLDKYDEKSEYAFRSINDKAIIPFAADWTLTKEGNRALINPILIVENNSTDYSNEGQLNFHKKCFDKHFERELFII